MGRSILRKVHDMMTDKPDGKRKGYDVEDYRSAVKEGESMRAASNILDVSRTTVRDMCVRHDIEVPTLGAVPEPLPSDHE